MYHKDHGTPHFHAFYGQYRATVGFDPIRVLEGKLSKRAQSLVFEWAAMYQDELRADWDLARAGERLRRIPPLE